MLDRARQRRENLDKKMAETPVPRKRPALPLGESQTENIMPALKANDDGKEAFLGRHMGNV